MSQNRSEHDPYAPHGEAPAELDTETVEPAENPEADAGAELRVQEHADAVADTVMKLNEALGGEPAPAADTEPVDDGAAASEADVAEENSAPAEEPVPDGTAGEVETWVAGDKARAQRALDVELQKDKPRKGLVNYLQSVVDAE